MPIQSPHPHGGSVTGRATESRDSCPPSARGRDAVIVPAGVLFESLTAHKALARSLVEDQKLDPLVTLPSGVCRPHAGVSTAILFFTKINSGSTDHVWVSRCA